ncbi:uncharacterized protein BDZ99DRAFT_524886 [Mytilinidion resinicola]|uniref:Uncharacterized protein n=1 Tax=Mytilinidion resinicola TaxID=574789 RepID=A0A6A6YAY6_9PEZI|nr:uncharacterized protein BDZ99DRAFT_524886 [Mytilinidion resinicola]KAF2805174.1 hypothetical protein BDZ99DRAFT_524886 [Mytilinidion resinicola]
MRIITVAETPRAFERAYVYGEKIQMAAFTIQQLILSGLMVNAIIIGLDIGLLTMAYLNKHVLEQTVKGSVFSVKLEADFAILSRLLCVTTNAIQSSELVNNNDVLAK